jgi:hypothetical protein
MASKKPGGSFAAHILVGIVRRHLHQIVTTVWVKLNGVIPASGQIEDLSDRAHIRFDTLRRHQARVKAQAAEHLVATAISIR